VYRKHTPVVSIPYGLLIIDYLKHTSPGVLCFGLHIVWQ